MEDFAQVFGVFPDEKYEKTSYRSIAGILDAETGDVGVAEFIRRLVFNRLIVNANKHLKNSSPLYPTVAQPSWHPHTASSLWCLTSPTNTLP